MRRPLLDHRDSPQLDVSRVLAAHIGRVGRPWHALAVLVLVALAPACTPPGVQYSVVPSAPKASTRPAEAQPVAPTGDRQLDAFLAEFASALDRHDWYAVARWLDPPTYAELHDAAVAAGATPEAAAATLIASALGLDALAPSGDEAPFAGLDRTLVVTLREASAIGSGVTRVQGDVRLADDSRLPLNAFVQKASGRYRLVLSRV